MSGGMAQVLEYLPSKPKALSSHPSATKPELCCQLIKLKVHLYSLLLISPFLVDFQKQTMIRAVKWEREQICGI
jgi:hypothetical protein